MNDQLLGQVAWIGENYLNGPVRAIVLEFPGLSTTGMKDGADPMEMEWGQAGVLSVVPYQGPWGWMAPATLAFTDELVSGLLGRYQLESNTPIIAIGGSMGGYSALVYTALSAHRIAACAANCPVCDLPFHYTERSDLPRTLHHAFGSYGDISEALLAHSPLYLAEIGKMPDVPYLIIHGDQDMAVNKVAHSDKLVPAMRAQGRTVDYRQQAGMGHCGPFDWVLQRRLTDFVLEQVP